MSVAAVVRAKGWGVGTWLIGDEGNGPSVIKITAVGEHSILAKMVTHNGVIANEREHTWTLSCRDWTEATAPKVSES